MVDWISCRKSLSCVTHPQYTHTQKKWPNGERKGQRGRIIGRLIIMQNIFGGKIWQKEQQHINNPKRERESWSDREKWSHESTRRHQQAPTTSGGNDVAVAAAAIATMLVTTGLWREIYERCIRTLCVGHCFYDVQNTHRNQKVERDNRVQNRSAQSLMILEPFVL